MKPEEIKKTLLGGMLNYMNLSAEAHYDQAHLDQCEKYLDEFRLAVAKTAGNYPQTMAQVEKTVVALNQLNDDCEKSLIETDQREDICAFIEEAIIAAGTDLDALAASQNCTRHEITDEWREW